MPKRIFGRGLALAAILLILQTQAKTFENIILLDKGTREPGHGDCHPANSRGKGYPSAPEVSLPERRQAVPGQEAASPENPGTLLAKLADLDTLAPSARQYFEPLDFSWRLLVRAFYYLNTPYRWGGSLRSDHTTDCSGFVQYVFQKSHIDLPRVSADQAKVGETAARSMDFSKLMAGDLLFFRRGGKHIGHVGIYVGEGKMIHASSAHRRVTISDLDKPYFKNAFVVAKRVLDGLEASN